MADLGTTVQDKATSSCLLTTPAAGTTPAAHLSSSPGFPALLGVWYITMVYKHDITCTMMSALNCQKPAQPLRDWEMHLAENFYPQVLL